MRGLNIFGREGMLTEEDRIKNLEHGCEHVTFVSCIDLSEPIRVIPHGLAEEISVEMYTRDLASFICWWTNTIMCDLIGFSGFNNKKFELVGFKLV